MILHDWRFSFTAVRVRGVCAACGATTQQGTNLAGIDTLGLTCPGRVETSHRWQVGAEADTAVAACPGCGSLRVSGLADGVGGSFGAVYAPRLDLSGECSAVSTVMA